MNQYCPHNATCPFYQNWEKREKDKRLGVIMKMKEQGETYYNCIALMDSDSPTTNPEQSRFECSTITLLNLLTKLDKILT